MAKLSAHGTEIARLKLTITRPDEPPISTVYSFRSDGYILSKYNVAGWTIWKRFSDRKITPDRVLAFAERMRDRYENRDWEYPDSDLTVEFIG